MLFDDAFPGVIASVACLATMQLMPAWDTGYTVAGLMLFCLFSASGMNKRNAAGCRALAGHWGVGLAESASLLVTLLWIAWLAVPRKSIAVYGEYCGAFFATLCLVMSLWVVRNNVQLGAPVLKDELWNVRIRIEQRLCLRQPR